MSIKIKQLYNACFPSCSILTPKQVELTKLFGFNVKVCHKLLNTCPFRNSMISFMYLLFSVHLPIDRFKNCVFCGQPDSSTHFWSKCDVVKSNICLVLKIPKTSFLGILLGSSVSDKLSLAWMILWCLWLRRNALIHGSVCIPIFKLIHLESCRLAWKLSWMDKSRMLIDLPPLVLSGPWKQSMRMVIGGESPYLPLSLDQCKALCKGMEIT